MMCIDKWRPGGVTLVQWFHGRCLIWDVTVPDTLAASHLDRTFISSGAAAEQYVNKMINHSDRLNSSHNYTSNRRNACVGRVKQRCRPRNQPISS